MSPLVITLIIIAALAVLGLIVHILISSRRRENLIRYYEDQKNERFEKELQEARDQWEADNKKMKDEFNQLLEKRFEPFKNLKDKLENK